MRHILFSLLIFNLMLAPESSYAQSDPRTVDFDVHFTSLVAGDPPLATTLTRWIPGVGGRIGYNLNQHFTIESELNFFPRGGRSDRIGEGRKAQALFGAKIGVRTEKVGLFGKARPGFMYFSEPNQECPLEENICNPLPKFRFAMDVGGVVEIYPSERAFVRFDVGDTLIRFPDFRNSVSEPGFPTVRVTLPGKTTHNFQFSVGVGVRF
jgi:hypothetical protein